MKDRIDKEFDHILRLLDFNNRGYEIFEDGTLMVKVIIT